MKRFPIDKNYSIFLQKNGMSVEEILKRAMLPEDLFARQTPCLDTEEYFRFMNAVQSSTPDVNAIINLVSADGIETFSPPVFAAYCSKNALTCLERLSHYKALVGALKYNVEVRENEVSVEILSADEELQLPEILVGAEFVFIIRLIRKATKKNIIPVCAMSTCKTFGTEYSGYIGTDVITGNCNSLVFSKSDTLIPFISHNESMWEFFEPELKRRLSMTETDDTYSARVRSALIELLPGGECTIDDVARKLGYSKRTIQRKLQEENTNFQKQLNHTRELLAKNYLSSTEMSAEDIAFLLGYRETGSFLRAFTIWTGQTLSKYKE